jgi:hypothetical protein
VQPAKLPWLPAAASPQELAEEEQLVWYCMACEKHFKSAAAFDNHERSKKHLQQVGAAWEAPGNERGDGRSLLHLQLMRQGSARGVASCLSPAPACRSCMRIA